MALGSNSGTYINSLIKAGSDVMHNLYFLKFSGCLIEDISTALTVRVQDFTPPVFTMGNDEKHYLTTSVSLPSASISGDKSLSFTFRLDSNYQVYEYLLKQQSSTLTGNIGWAINRVPKDVEAEGGLIITAYAFDRSLGDNPDEEENYSKLYTFKYCYITGLSGLAYSYDNVSPLTIKADIKFLDYEDPMNLLTKKK